MRNFIIGVCPTATKFSEWHEDFQHVRIIEEEVDKCGDMVAFKPVLLSHRL